ncbi:hypothetical protein E1A91_D10G057100v1, partial [Gossypium mustelinum]
RLCVLKKYGGLGFRNLFCFNLALLAKQGWRFLTSPESLSCKVFKARYCSDSDFLDSTEGSALSFIWKSITRQRNVSNDPWINDGENFYVDTAPLEGCENMQVCYLIHSNEGYDAKRILAMPLS